MRIVLLALVSGACVGLIGCPDDETTDASVPDTAMRADASVPDTAVADTAVVEDGATADGAVEEDAAVGEDAAVADTGGGSEPTPRFLHAAASLSDGRVLVTGGSYAPDDSTLSEVWRFDPANDAWSREPDMSIGRAGHTATLLANGRVLIAGGARYEMERQREERAIALLYDAATSSITTTGAMVHPRLGHKAFRLTSGPDAGKVLIIGGFAMLTAVRTPELYDPTAGTFTEVATAMLPEPLNGSSAVQLANGNVLITGGTLANGDLTTAAYIYDASTQMLALTTGALNVARRDHTSTLLEDGRVLIAGGRLDRGRTDAAELFDPGDGSFTLTDPMTSPRASHAAVKVTGGDVWILGGADNMVLDTIEVYNGAMFALDAATLDLPLALHTATVLDDGRILVVGGQSRNGMLNLSYQLLTP